jgi:hypothetical protein
MLKWPKAKRLRFARSEVEDNLTPERVKFMVKRESGHNVPRKPRGIQYYVNPVTQAFVARQITALQKSVVATFRRLPVGVARITVASEMNAAQLGGWMDEVLRDHPNAYFVEIDGENWDSTMSRAHHNFKLEFYKAAVVDVVDFVNRSYTVTGKMRQGDEVLHYWLDGTVKSGHNDTSLGNSLVNLGICYVIAKRIATGVPVDILVCGDDSLLVFHEPVDATLVRAIGQEYGILPKCRGFPNVVDASFISGIWVPAKHGLAFVPKPARLLARLFWTTHPPAPKNRAAFAAAVAKGLLPALGTFPGIGTFLTSHIKTDTLLLVTGKSYQYVGCRFEYDDEIYAYLFGRYGITREEVCSFQSLCEVAGGRCGILRHVVIDKFNAVDLPDPEDRPLSDYHYHVPN